MIRKMPELREQVLSNGTFKFVALVASVVLWLTVLGRKDAIVIKNFNIEYIVKENYTISQKGNNFVRVKVKGPRVALQKFKTIEDSIAINLQKSGPGDYSVRIPKDGGLDLPLGVRILSIEPNKIRVKIKEIEVKN